MSRACNEDIAKNLAYYGTIEPDIEHSAARARLEPSASGEDITITGPDANGTITLSTSHLYESSPLFGWLGIAAIRINSYQQEQYSGW